MVKFESKDVHRVDGLIRSRVKCSRPLDGIGLLVSLVEGKMISKIEIVFKITWFLILC